MPGTLFRYFLAALSLLVFGSALWAYFHLVILQNPPETLPSFIRYALVLTGWISKPDDLASNLLEPYFQGATEAIAAGLLGRLAVAYPTFLMTLPADQALERIQHSLGIALAQNGVVTSLDQTQTVLSGIAFTPNHQPSDDEVLKARAIAGDSFAYLSKQFDQNSTATQPIQTALKLLYRCGVIRAVSFMAPFLLAIAVAANRA